MIFRLREDLAQAHQTLQIGLLTLYGVKNNLSQDETYQILCHEVDKLRVEYVKNPAPIDHKLKTWEDAFITSEIDPTKTKPSHISLIRRILDGKELPNINPVVNLTSALSIKYLTPIGAHDLDQCGNEINIGKTDKAMPFTPIGSTETIEVPAGTVAYADENTILTNNWVWRQSISSQMTDESTDIFVPIDTIGRSEEEIKQIASELLGMVQQYLDVKKSFFAVLSASTPELMDSDLIEITSTYRSDLETHPISRDPEIIERILEKAVEDVVPTKDMLREMLLSGRRLKVYQGYDPTAPSLHIGHTVMMRKLEDFRKLGHEAYMLIGDFTGRIGDPTDKTSARVPLTTEQVNENLKLYQQQAEALLDIKNPENPIKVVFNNDWLGKMNFADILDLCSNFTVQQMIKRHMFQVRLKEDKPIFIHEFMYPMMQGYDSLAMGVDVELGGNDQFFNMLAGRQLVGTHALKEKVVVSGKLLTTAEGKKMGKSEGNAINLSDDGVTIYGKVMSFTDEMVISGFELLTNVALDEVELNKARLASGENPMTLKKELAYLVTLELKGKNEAEKGKTYFEEVFQKQNYETEMKEIEKPENILELIKSVKGGDISNSQARRLIDQGAVSIDDVKVTDINHPAPFSSGSIVKIGKDLAKIR